MSSYSEVIENRFMENNMKIIIIILCCFYLPVLFAQEGLGLVTEKEDLIEKKGRQYLFIIGISKYLHQPSLQYPVNDAKKIKQILTKRYYVDETIEIYDEQATKDSIINSFQRLIEILEPEDSLLIFYAGHGKLDEETGEGAWIPFNGGLDPVDQLYWVPNHQITGFISAIKARHILLISDSCFSGSLINRSGIPALPSNRFYQKAYSKIARQVITSGNIEPVPDKSEFTYMLKMFLENNTQPYIDPLAMYIEIRLGMTKTDPLLGVLPDTGHQEGAGFLLFLKETVRGEEDISQQEYLEKFYNADSAFEAPDWYLSIEPAVGLILQMFETSKIFIPGI